MKRHLIFGQSGFENSKRRKDSPLFVHLLKAKNISRERAMALRNIVSTIARPNCPVKMVLACALGKEVVKP